MPSDLVAVLDTNVWVSGIFFRRGIPATILRAWRDRRFEIVVTAETLGELERELQEKVKVLSEAVESTKRFDALLGSSPLMQRLYEQLGQVADTEASVLVTGESGTGKELVARAIHSKSRRFRRGKASLFLPGERVLFGRSERQ